MLCLSTNDILKAVSCQEVVMAVEKAMIMYEKKEFYMPQRIHLDYNGNTLLLMPCFTPESMATKLLSVFPGNRDKKKMVMNGIVVLNNAETGEPIALFNGAKLTAVRTGAIGSVGVRYITDPGITTVGIIGLGIQGFHQAIFACAVRKIQKIIIYDINPESQHGFMEQFHFYYPRIEICPVERIEDMLSQTDLIIAATPSETPVIPDDEEMIKGKKFVGIGSFKPQMREFPESLFRNIQSLFIDTDHALTETGDLIDPLNNGWISQEQIIPAGKLVLGEATVDQNKTYLFKSVGMALFDLVVSDYIFQKAREEGIGTEVEI
jgi:ornithine cyclodeaminase/alanine dehydrogenase-like protein (mu-crystallin family)